MEFHEYVAQEDRVLVLGFAKGRIKATNKTWEDDWVFAITVRDGKLTNIREYIDTQALARASKMGAGSRLCPIEKCLRSRGGERERHCEVCLFFSDEGGDC
jgi:hypothetical protein